MILPINNNTRIISDKYCWIVQVRTIPISGKLAGQEVWTAQSYHPSAKAALVALGERLMRESETKTWAEAVERMHEITGELAQCLDQADLMKSLLKQEGL